ncbi:MAG: hypothetical protein DRI65_13840 [Chloroflexota bacterium]|nr:MAG: hypothetical protein DRI65_13840 [Chloroflexota bacterium]
MSDKLRRKEYWTEVEVNGVHTSVRYVESDEDWRKYEIECVRSIDCISDIIDPEVLEYIEEKIEEL